MRKAIGILIYTIIVLLIGRNLSFLPRFYTAQSVKSATTSLEKELKEFVKSKPGTYSIYYKDLHSDATIDILSNQVYTGASINKTYIIAVLYNLAKDNKIDLNQRIVVQKEDIQDYGTGSLRYEKPGKAYSLKTLAKLSMQQSDNTAAYIIANRIGRDTIQKTINSWGISQTSMANNQTSLSDLFIVFNKLYLEEITTQALTKELLEFMRNTDFEDRLSFLLPKDAKMYHKTGDAEGGVHDAGIVEYGKSLYFIGVLTNDISDREKETKSAIAEISKKIFDKVTNQN